MFLFILGFCYPPLVLGRNLDEGKKDNFNTCSTSTPFSSSSQLLKVIQRKSGEQANLKRKDKLKEDSVKSGESKGKRTFSSQSGVLNSPVQKREVNFNALMMRLRKESKNIKKVSQPAQIVNKKSGVLNRDQKITGEQNAFKDWDKKIREILAKGKINIQKTH